MAVLDDSWREKAACLGRPTNLWFPKRGDYATAAEAIAICNGCPVRAECRADADAQRIRGGIRGGVSMDRAARLRRRPTAQCGTRSGYNAGCDCPACSEANNAYRRRSRAG